jgi:hypothetical protein
MGQRDQRHSDQPEKHRKNEVSSHNGGRTMETQISSPGPTREEMRDFFIGNDVEGVTAFVLHAQREFPNATDPIYQLITRQMQEVTYEKSLLEKLEELELGTIAVIRAVQGDSENLHERLEDVADNRECNSDSMFPDDGDVCQQDIQENDEVKDALKKLFTEVYDDIAAQIERESYDLWKKYVEASKEVFPELTENEAVFEMTQIVIRSALIDGSIRNLSENVEAIQEVIDELEDDSDC